MPQETTTAKRRILELVERQPEDSSYDEILREIAREAWEHVIARRVRELEAGTAAAVPWSEVQQRLFSFERATPTHE